MSTAREVLIAGSGFAGLALGISLKRFGIPCRILEATAQPTHIGGAVTIFPNGMKVLRGLKIADAAIEAGAKVSEVIFLDHFGKKIVTSPRGAIAKYGEPTIAIRRATLFQLLQEAAASEKVDIQYGKKIASLEETQNEVFVRCADGSEFSGRSLIGADGVHSTIRKFVAPATPSAHYANQVFWGGFTALSALPKAFRLEPRSQEVIVGPVGFFGYNFVDPTTNSAPHLHWYCYLRQDDRLSREQLEQVSEAQVREKVVNAHLGWRGPIRELVENSSSFCRANVHDILNLESWHTQRVLLIGDAAHAMNPVSGQGASTAMEDALLLAELLKFQEGDAAPAPIFEEFEKLRRPRVTKLTQDARVSGERTMIHFGPIGCRLRNLTYAALTKLVPEGRYHWAYGYDVQSDKAKALQELGFSNV